MVTFGAGCGVFKFQLLCGIVQFLVAVWCLWYVGDAAAGKGLSGRGRAFGLFLGGIRGDSRRSSSFNMSCAEGVSSFTQVPLAPRLFFYRRSVAEPMLLLLYRC